MSIRLKSGIPAASLAVILAAGTAQGRQCDPTYWAELKRAEANPDEGTNRDLAAYLRALTPEKVEDVDGRADLCAVYTSFGVDDVKEVDDETLETPHFDRMDHTIQLVSLIDKPAIYDEKLKLYVTDLHTTPLVQGRLAGRGDGVVAALNARAIVMDKIRNGSLKFGDFADPDRNPHVGLKTDSNEPEYQPDQGGTAQDEYWSERLDIPVDVLDAAYKAQMQANRVEINSLKSTDYFESLGVLIAALPLWLWYRRTKKSGGFGYKIIQFEESRDTRQPVWIGGRRWIFAEREWRRIARTNGQAFLWDPTPRQQRIADDLHGQINRSRAVWWIGLVFVAAAALLAFNHANQHDPTDEFSRAGFVVAGLGVIAALVLIAAERLYRSGWQAMPGAMVLDPETDTLRTENQQPHGASADESTI